MSIIKNRTRSLIVWSKAFRGSNSMLLILGKGIEKYQDINGIKGTLMMTKKLY